MKATTSIFIDKYHPKANGQCAVSLRVTFERKKKYYPTPVLLSVSDYEKVFGPKPRDNFKATALRLRAYENKANEIISSMESFSWKAFEKQYLSNRALKLTIDQAFTEYSAELRSDDRIGTAVSYECARKSLHSFHPGTKFGDVTPEFLRRYEKSMLSMGNSVTTVGIYLRSLRTILNNAIEEGLLSKELYPFGKKKYEIPSSNNTKKSLSIKDIAQIYYYKAAPGSTAEMAKDHWLFMYLCNGINVKDMCLLKYENIKGEILEFERAKTARTKRKVEPIRVSLSEDAIDIIQKWGNADKAPGNYVFKVLSPGLDATRARNLIQQHTKTINSYMREIATELGITSLATTYVARHSFASILQRSGASTEFISEALGHSNVKTTQNYLAGFEDDVKKETAKALTAFKKPSNPASD